MVMSAQYDPSLIEEKWYQQWLRQEYFEAKPIPGKTPYTILIPPPNITGILHMGHILNNTLQDVLIRKARMEGKEACWMPGTDHASIATEARIWAMLQEKGIQKTDLTREQFLSYAHDWKEKYGNIILDQLKKMGASCCWNRTRFTMDESYYKAVTRVFVDLYQKGHIYRGWRMINWDCEAKTALSNEEVWHNENGEKSTLYYIRYSIEGTSEYITVATLRPETIMGDVAISIHPSDERYIHLKGKTALIPLINRQIPIVTDNYVDKNFGTGCLKITPAHDSNDYEIGIRHNLPFIDIINDDGTLNEKCQIPHYIKKDRFTVRREIVEELKTKGFLEKEEECVTRIGRSERTNSIVEPKLSLQWFMKMKTISTQAQEAIEKDKITLYPPKYKNAYLHWMTNIKDWCISRQLWWGHRIPAYYYGPGNDDFVVAETPDEALEQVQKLTGQTFTPGQLRQDDDVLDTWFSSWLWPIAVFNGFSDTCFEDGKINLKKNPTLGYFYPTNVLVTAPEILFFWVARMIIAGYEYMDEKPFQKVYLTGIVRDKQRRKMSKSLGNSPDPLELIATYGADGVRTGMLFSSPAGNDLLFDEKLCEQGRNFCNKIWNALRLVKQWESRIDHNTEYHHQIAVLWFESRLHQALEQVENHFSKFRISDALQELYRWVWDDFCSRYLEMVKPQPNQPIDGLTLEKTTYFFEIILKVLHPFMPFITEELWHELKHREENDDLTISPWPEYQSYDTDILTHAKTAFTAVALIRSIRNKLSIPFKESLVLIDPQEGIHADFLFYVKKLANLSEVRNQDLSKTDNSFSFLVGTKECFIILPHDKDVEKERMEMEKELIYQQRFLKSVMKKLENKQFLMAAPNTVINHEKQKKADAETKIEVLEERLKKSE